MIEKYKSSDLNTIMEIWLNTNIETHYFIEKKYWIDSYDIVKEMLPKSELYVYRNNKFNIIDGFIGLTNNFIEGIFVKSEVQSKGIGKQLLDYIKISKSSLNLKVYKKNKRAILFYKRENFLIHSEDIDENTNEKEFIMMWNK